MPAATTEAVAFVVTDSCAFVPVATSVFDTRCDAASASRCAFLAGTGFDGA